MIEERFSQLDDIIIFQNENFRCVQTAYGEMLSEVMCPNCKKWVEIDFDHPISNIDGMKIGKKNERTVIKYPYRVSVYEFKCGLCNFKSLYDRDGKEFTAYDSSSPIDTCVYRTVSGITKTMEYSMFNAETIAKYMLGYIHRSIYLIGYGYDYIDSIKKILLRGVIMDVCLLGVIIYNITEENLCSETVLEKWYKSGIDILPTPLRRQAEEIAMLFM